MIMINKVTIIIELIGLKHKILSSEFRSISKSNSLVFGSTLEFFASLQSTTDHCQAQEYAIYTRSSIV
jgi:hypothetical protein